MATATKSNGVWSAWKVTKVKGEKGDRGPQGYPGMDGENGEQGAQGIQGCIIRKAEWTSGTQFRNDEALTSGTRYLDVALVRDSSLTTGWAAYKCLRTHTASSSNRPGSGSYWTTYWEEFAINANAIFTSLIIAKDASIDFVQGNELLIKGSDGVTVEAGLSGSSATGGDVRLWVGGETPDDAPFTVDKYGALVATDAKVEGEVTMGVAKYKSRTANGSSVSLEGYSLANGPGTYTMPRPTHFMQVYGMCLWFSRTARIFKFKVYNTERFVTKGTNGAVYSAEIDLNDNKLYRFTCIPDDTWGTVWFVSAEDLITL